MGLRTAGAVVALVAVLTGCSLSGRSAQKGEQQARNAAEITVIQSELAKAPGVAEIDVNYSDYITAPGAAQISLIVTSGTDLERVADLAVGAIWRSQLDPLESIRVDVVNDEDRRVGIERGYDVVDHQAELEAKYGPRPVPGATTGTG